MHTIKHLAIVCVTLLCGAGSAAAQQPAPPVTPGPLVLEPIGGGFVAAPEVKFTDFAGTTGTLVGAYAGYLKDEQFFIGGGGYGLAYSRNNGNSLGYGGMIVGWIIDPHRAVTAGVKSLFGFGESTQSFAQTVVVPIYDHDRPSVDPQHPTGPPVTTTVTQQVHLHNHFAIFEPEADVVARLGGNASISAGVGYRVVTDDYYRPYIRGVTGTVSVQFGF